MEEVREAFYTIVEEVGEPEVGVVEAAEINNI